MIFTRWNRRVVAAGLGVVVVSSAAAGQEAAGDSTVFEVAAGAQALVRESFVRTPERLGGRMEPAIAAIPRVRYEARLGPDARVTHLETVRFDTLRGTTDFEGDSATVVAPDGGTRRVAAAPGAMPFLNPSAAFVEQLFLRARALDADSLDVPIFAPGSPVARVVRGGVEGTVTLMGITIRAALEEDGRLAGACVPAQALVLRRVHPEGRLPAGCPGGAQAAAAPAPPDYSAPAGAPYTAEEVRVPTPAGHVLAGTLTVPKGAAGRVPAVVLVTGSGAQDRDAAIPVVGGYRFFRQVADTLTRRGIAVLRLDDRGWGGSGGDASTATTADFAEDARAAVAFLRARAEIDPARVAVAGHSEGASIAAMVAAEDRRIAAVALLAGTAWTGRRVNEYQNREVLARSGASSAQVDSFIARLPAVQDSLGREMPWFRFFLDYDPKADVRRVRAPVLVLQGETDRQVTAGQAGELAEAARAGGNRRVTVRVFPEINHLFLRDPAGTATVEAYNALPSKEVPSEVLGALADWLAARLLR